MGNCDKMFALAKNLNISEIPFFKFFITHFLRHCIMGSLTGAGAS